MSKKHLGGHHGWSRINQVAGLVKGDDHGGGARFYRTLWSLLKFGLLLSGKKELFTVVEHRGMQFDLYFSSISVGTVLYIESRRLRSELLRQVWESGQSFQTVL